MELRMALLMIRPTYSTTSTTRGQTDTTSFVFGTDEHTYFYLLFVYLTANFNLLSRGQPHSPDVKHCVIQFRPEGHREP